jgi:hypothetical protein
VQKTKPAQPFRPRDGRIRRRRRGEDEERRPAECSSLGAELRTLTKDALVRRLPDERDDLRRQRRGKLAEPLACPDEVGRAEVAGASRRPPRGVREADSEREELELLMRLERSGCEPGGMQQPPEVVPRVREVGTGGGARPARVDPAEDDPEIGPEDVGNGRRSQAASASRSSRRTSSDLRSRSPAS